MTIHRTRLGRRGEEIAERYLTKRGYRVIDRRWHGRYGEIDLIASDARATTLVFVEVKTRSSDSFGGLDASIDRRKLERLSLAIDRYVAEHRYRGPYRLDVVLVKYDSPIRIRHLRNVGFE